MERVHKKWDLDTYEATARDVPPIENAEECQYKNLSFQS